MSAKRYYDSFSDNYGFTGIAVALLGRNHPAGVFIAALIAFVIVPRSASKKALAVASRIEARPDSGPTVAARDRYLTQVNTADSVLTATRQALIPVPAAAWVRRGRAVVDPSSSVRLGSQDACPTRPRPGSPAILK